MRYGRTSIISFLSQLAVAFSGFFGTVVLTRVLGKDQYGGYVVVMSVLAWAAIAGNWGLSAAVKKRLSEADGVDYVIPGLVTQVGLYLFVAIALWVARPYLNAYIGFDATLIVIVLLAGSLATGFVRSVLDGRHLVHVSSVLQPIRMGSQSVAQIALVLAGYGLLGAFAGYLLSTVVATIIGAYFVTTEFRIPSRRDFHRLRTYAQYSWFASIRNQTFASMDTIILAFFVTNSVVGGYKAAWNLASLFALFSISIRRTLFPEMSNMASQADNRDAITGLLRESLTYAGLFIIPGLLGSALLGDVILTVYGEGFAEGYYILLILASARLLYGYQEQFLSTIDAVDHPELTFQINLVFVLLNLALNVVLTAQFGWYGAAFATTISSAMGLLLGFQYASNLVEVAIPVVEIGKQIVAALIMVVVVLPGRILLNESLLTAVPLAGLGAVVYFYALFVLSPKFRNTVEDNLPFSVPGF